MIHWFVIGGIALVGIIVISGIAYLIRKNRPILPTSSSPVSNPLIPEIRPHPPSNPPFTPPSTPHARQRTSSENFQYQEESDAQTYESYLKRYKIQNMDDNNPASVDQFLGMPCHVQAKYVRFFAPKPNPATDLTPEMLERVMFAAQDECRICLNEPAQIVYLPCMHALACCNCDFDIITMQLSKQLGGDDKMPKTTLLSKEFVKGWLENHFTCYMCRCAVEKRVKLPEDMCKHNQY